MKISKVALNGKNILINDIDAVQLPEEVEIQDGDMLIYRVPQGSQTGTFQYIQKDDIVDVENGVVEGSQKLVKSGDVYTAIQNSSGSSVKRVNLDVTYNSENHNLTFRVAQNTPNPLQANVQLLILSVNTSYNQNLEELRISNIVDVLILTPSTQGGQITKNIPIYPEDRTLYFVVINNDQNVQNCYLPINSVNIPGTTILANNQISATVVAPIDNDGVQAIRFTAMQAVDVDVECRVNLGGLADDPYCACYVRGTIQAGQTSVIVPIISTYNNRPAALSIVPQDTSDQYSYTLANTNLSVPGTLQLNVITPTPQNTPVIAFVAESNKLPTINVKFNMSFPRNGISPIDRVATLNANNQTALFDYTDISWNGPSVYISVDSTTSRDDNYVYVVGPASAMEIITNVDGDGQPW